MLALKVSGKCWTTGSTILPISMFIMMMELLEASLNVPNVYMCNDIESIRFAGPDAYSQLPFRLQVVLCPN